MSAFIHLLPIARHVTSGRHLTPWHWSPTCCQLESAPDRLKRSPYLAFYTTSVASHRPNRQDIRYIDSASQCL